MHRFHYQGNPDGDDVDIAFVGKGITYDTGGLNIKGTGAMEKMYIDKGGACAVLGALKGTLELQFKMNIVFCMAVAENSVDANSYKPCDIIKSMKGLTVEILNTDAEGRLVLADALTYVQKFYKVKRIVDLATLTGAIMIALGKETAGLFTNDYDGFGKQILDSGKEVFEKYWHMPMPDESKEQCVGKFSDLQNVVMGNPHGGSSRAAAFLERFIEKGVQWTHLDIAGAVDMDGGIPPYKVTANGFGVQSLLAYCKNFSNKQ